MSILDIPETVPCQKQLGEGLLWDHRQNHFLWSDIKGKLLHILPWGAERDIVLSLQDMLCSFGLTENPDILIAAFTRSIEWLNIRTGETQLIRSFDLPPGIRMNDGRIGPDGAFYVGTMVEDKSQSDGKWGQLLRFASDGEPQVLLEGIHISNGLCWSPDERTMYHSDSPKQLVMRYDFDPQTGEIGHGEPYIKTEKGVPDGAVTSLDGHYLSALWDGSRVGIYDSNGNEVRSLPMPAPQVTIPCFGGPDLDILATASAWDGMVGDKRHPKMGNLFFTRPGLTGSPSEIFRGDTPHF